MLLQKMLTSNNMYWHIIKLISNANKHNILSTFSNSSYIFAVEGSKDLFIIINNIKSSNNNVNTNNYVEIENGECTFLIYDFVPYVIIPKSDYSRLNMYIKIQSSTPINYDGDYTYMPIFRVYKHTIDIDTVFSASKTQSILDLL